MKKLALLPAILSCLLPACALAATQSSGDAQVMGQIGVGTAQPQARLEVKISSADAFALKVSSQNGDSLLVLDSRGRLGVGVSSPAAKLDVGDGAIGLQLRVGNSSMSATSAQIVFAYDSTATFRHSIRTQANPEANLGNSIDFYLWRSTGQPAALGEEHVLSLQSYGTASTACAVHVRPVGTPEFELEVSSGGGVTGGGTMHRATAETHSMRALKSDIAYMNEAAERRAYEDIKALRHARFRYKALSPTANPNKPIYVENPGQPISRGLIYEDSPESIRGPSKTLVVDYRVMSLELALKEADRRVRALESQISAIEAQRKKRGGGR